MVVFQLPIYKYTITGLGGSKTASNIDIQSEENSKTINTHFRTG